MGAGSAVPTDGCRRAYAQIAACPGSEERFCGLRTSTVQGGKKTDLVNGDETDGER